VASLEEKAEQKRTAILSTTLDLIYENGFHGTPMSLIADKAKVGYGTIYRYFKNKEELITELFREIKDEIKTAMLCGYNTNESVKDRYSKAVHNLIMYYIQNTRKFKFIEQFTFSPFIDRKTRTVIEEDIHRPFIALFSEGLKKGDFKNIPYELIYSLTYGTVSFLVNLHIDGQFSLSEPDHIDLAVASCWDAVKG